MLPTIKLALPVALSLALLQPAAAQLLGPSWETSVTLN
jgi:hypothetical protein